MFAGLGLLALHYYSEQQPGWLTFILVVLGITVVCAIADLLGRLIRSSRHPG